MSWLFESSSPNNLTSMQARPLVFLCYINLKGKAWLSSQESRFGDGQQHHHHDDDDDDEDEDEEEQEEEEAEACESYDDFES